MGKKPRKDGDEALLVMDTDLAELCESEERCEVEANLELASEASSLGGKSSKTSPMDKKPRKDGGSNQPSSSAQMSDLATSRNQLLFGLLSPVHLWLQDEAHCRVLELSLREFRAGRDAVFRAWAFSLWSDTRTGVTRYPEPLWR